MEHESDDCTNCDWIIKRPGGVGSWRMGRDYPNDSIAENVQNPETSPGDLRRLAVTDSREKPSANTDVKNSKGVNNNNNNNNYYYYNNNNTFKDGLSIK